MSKASKEFSDRLRRDFCKAPDARDVLHVEKQLGASALRFQLSPRGTHELFKALDKERSTKLAAQDG